MANILEIALQLHKAGRLDEAAALYRRVLIEYPDQADSLHLLALAGQKAGRPQTKLPGLRRAVHSQPELLPAHNNLAQTLQEVGLIDEAEIHYRKVLAGEPDNLAIAARLCQILMNTGRIDEAEPILRRLRDWQEGRERTELALERIAIQRRIRAAAADPSLPSGLVVRGVFRDNSGYAYKVRQFVRHLVAAGVPVHLVDLLYQPMKNLADHQIDPLFHTLNRPVRAKAVLNFTTPPVVEVVEGLKTITYSVIETTRLLPLWANHSPRHDATIVATTSSRDAWTASGCPAERIHICPEGVEAVSSDLPPLDLRDDGGRHISDYPVRILNVSDFAVRKNLEGLLRVWLRATSAGQDAALILKIGKSANLDGEFQHVIARAVQDAGKPVSAAAPIFIITGQMTDAEMLNLYGTATHYWSMSHGEGWDLPMTQAGAMGLTLLAPNHSAYRDYLNDDVAFLIPSTVTDGKREYGPQQWWTPDEQAATELIGAIADGSLRERRSAQRHLLDNFSWERSTGRLIGILEGLEAL